MQHTNPSSATASPAASSPELPAPGGLCAIHQPNLFPRLTTLAKLFAADYWIVLDDVQFARRDYQHRARLADIDNPARRQWLTIPTHLPQGRPTLVRDAQISAPDLALRRVKGMLHQYFGASRFWPDLAQVLEPVLNAIATGRTATVAESSTRVLLDLLGWQGLILRSSRLPARTGRSQRLADLASHTGARGYLCGTGGMKYLDADLFITSNITVIPFRTPSDRLWTTGRETSVLHPLMCFGPAVLADLLKGVASNRDGHAAAGLSGSASTHPSGT